jgi:hypothetical protein
VRKTITCLLLFNLLSFTTYSQQWFEGSLVLSNSEVHIGRISFECDHDLVLFEKNDSRMIFPAHKIKSVYFYDSTTNINRRYVSLKVADGAGSRYYFYEIVLAGEIDVLRRKKSSAFSKHIDPLDYNYFIYYNETLTPLQKFKRKIFPHLQSTSDRRLAEFITARRLNIHLPENAIQIIEYYNSVANNSETIARN